jgi:polysaccharide biosynthesis/export protein
MMWLLACCSAAFSQSPPSSLGSGATAAPAATVPATEATAVPTASGAGAAATLPLAKSPTPTAAVPATVPDGYKLRPGDMLQVAVWKETDLQADVLIRPDGGITFALAGDLQAAGYTVAELTDILQARIRKFIPDAVVTVAVKTAGGNRVYVIGKVQRPGDFPLIGPIDVMQALTLAGGATPFADMNSIRILRRDGDRQISIKFRYGDILHGRRLEENILLKNGDTVVVP